MTHLPISNLDKVRRWLTISDDLGAAKVPLGNSFENREGGCLDVCIKRSVDLDAGLAVEISIRTDGTVRWMATKPDNQDANPYWRFSRGNPDRPATAAQRRVLALIWLGQMVPFGLGGLSAPVCCWAFANSTPMSLAQEFGVDCPPLNFEGARAF